jgi:hypothetical protein
MQVFLATLGMIASNLVVVFLFVALMIGVLTMFGFEIKRKK